MATKAILCFFKKNHMKIAEIIPKSTLDKNDEVNLTSGSEPDYANNLENI